MQHITVRQTAMKQVSTKQLFKHVPFGSVSASNVKYHCYECKRRTLHNTVGQIDNKSILQCVHCGDEIVRTTKE